MLLGRVFVVLCTLGLVLRAGANSGPGMCSDVFQMHTQYCGSPQVSAQAAGPPKSTDKPRVGKSGPRGPAGPPGTVDYEAINAKLDEKFKEFETLIEKKLEKHADELNANWKAKIRDVTEKIDSVKLRTYPQSCKNVYRGNAKTWDGTGGVFDIYPTSKFNSIEVYCDLTRDDGGWTVFQRRFDGTENFFRNYNDYVNGFGETDKEMWLGLERLYQLTKDGTHELRVDIADWEGNVAFANYGIFSISNAADNYTLTVGKYSGDAGDSLTDVHNGRPFSARTKDLSPNGNCVRYHKGGWWYGDCFLANLNGHYYKSGKYSSKSNDGVVWHTWKDDSGYSLKSVEMKFRARR